MERMIVLLNSKTKTFLGRIAMDEGSYYFPSHGQVAAKCMLLNYQCLKFSSKCWILDISIHLDLKINPFSLDQWKRHSKYTEINSLSVIYHLLNVANGARLSPEIIEDALEIRKHYYKCNENKVTLKWKKKKKPLLKILVNISWIPKLNTLMLQ